MYQKILVAVDGSETSARALDAALQLAHDADAQLQPVFVVDVPVMACDVPAYDPSYVRNALFEEGKHVIDDAAARMQRAGVPGTPRIIEADLVGDDIAQCAVLMISAHGAKPAASCAQAALASTKEPS
jgi:nucleotide-binding universal stress UspA family protein